MSQSCKAGIPPISTFAGSAVAAPVAGEARAACGAGFAELARPQGNRLLKERPFRRTKLVLRHPALKAQARKVRLSALNSLIRYAVLFSVLDEHRAGLDEVERDVVAAALVAQSLRPFVMARPRPIVVLAPAEDLLELAGSEVTFGIDRADERSRHEALVLGGNVEKDGQPFVCPCLVLRRDLENDVLVTVAPIGRQMVVDAPRPLGEDAEHDIGALSDHRPRLVAPGVRLLDEEVRGKPDQQLHAGSDLEASVTPTLQRHVEVGVAGHLRGVDAAHTVEEVHVAMLASLAHLMAAVPRIPDDHIKSPVLQHLSNHYIEFFWQVILHSTIVSPLDYEPRPRISLSNQK